MTHFVVDVFFLLSSGPKLIHSLGALNVRLDVTLQMLYIYMKKMFMKKLKKKNCSFCSKAFSTNSKLNDHLKRIHENKKDLKCNICAMTFSVSNDLRNHIKNVHKKQKKEKNLKCDFCDKMFSEQGDINYHKKQAHTNEEIYNCEHCKKNYFSSNTLKRHI